MNLLAYQSFKHAQGNQPLQVHFIEAYARMLRVHAPIDYSGLDEPLAQIRRRRLPASHMTIPDDQREAQFEFWWWLVFDILTSVYTGKRAKLPSRMALNARAETAGGTTEMSSFTDAEMTDLDTALAIYRDDGDSVSWTARHVVTTLFVPQLITVETNFQGRGDRYPSRPRTDGGDPHTSRMLQYCEKARAEWRPGDLTSEIYLMVCRALDEAMAGKQAELDAVAHGYRTLVTAYNEHHPDQPVARLHVPWTSFSEASRAAVEQAWWPS